MLKALNNDKAQTYKMMILSLPALTAGFIVAGSILLEGLFIAAYGLIFKKNPPVINEGIGYRTSLSRKNADTWTTANSYYAELSMIGGSVLTCLGLIMFTLSRNILEPGTLIGSGLIPVIAMTPIMSFIIISIFVTEIHLNKLFDENGNRREKEQKV